MRKDEEKWTSYNYWHAGGDCAAGSGIYFENVEGRQYVDEKSPVDRQRETRRELCRE